MGLTPLHMNLDSTRLAGAIWHYSIDFNTFLDTKSTQPSFNISILEYGLVPLKPNIPEGLGKHNFPRNVGSMEKLLSCSISLTNQLRED